MELIPATIEHIEDYIRLQNDFNNSNKESESNVCSALASIEDADRTHFEKIYKEKIEQENTYFVFMKNDGLIYGFFYGFFVTLPSLFNPKKIGYFGTVFISKPGRGKGYHRLCQRALY